MHEDPVTSSTTRVPGERLELGEGREVVLNVTISNTGDPAYFAWVTLNFRHGGTHTDFCQEGNFSRGCILYRYIQQYKIHSE
jgi:hypothetical protein